MCYAARAFCFGMWKMMKTIEKCSAKWLQRGLIAVIILMFFLTTGVVNVQAQEENPPEHPGESAPRRKANNRQADS